MEAHDWATAGTATGFLERLVGRMPFPVKAMQVDGGSEYQGELERAWRERGTQIFVLPAHSPTLSGYLERAQRTHKEELYPSTMREPST